MYKNSLIIKYTNKIAEIPCDTVYKLDSIYYKENEKFDILVRFDKEKNCMTVTVKNQTYIISREKFERIPEYSEVSFLHFINEEKAFAARENKNITIGEKNCLINVPEAEGLYLEIDKTDFFNIGETEIFINGIKERNIMYGNLEEGNFLFAGALKFVLYKDKIIVQGNPNLYNSSLYKRDIKKKFFEHFPFYERSPRMIKGVPGGKISLKHPLAKRERSRRELFKLILPPVGMLIVTIGLGFFLKRGVYIVMGIAGTSMTLVVSIINYISDKKEMKEQNILRDKVYRKYLLDTRKKLDLLRRQEKEALSYHNPSIQEIHNLVENYSSRIYEKTPMEEDFLEIPLGLVKAEPSYSVEFISDVLEIKKDPLLEEAEKVCSEFNVIENIPYTINLKNTHLGITGEKGYVHEQLKLIFAHLTFFCSYHDLNIILIHNGMYRKEFDYLKWYPHFKIKELNVRTLIDNEREREQTLGGIEKILKARETAKNNETNKNRETTFSPHYLIVIDEPDLISNHPITEFIRKKDSKLGISVIYTGSSKAKLPENIKTIIQINNYDEAVMLMQDGFYENKKITLRHIAPKKTLKKEIIQENKKDEESIIWSSYYPVNIIENENDDIKKEAALDTEKYNNEEDKNHILEDIARKLSPIEHIKTAFNAIPESITFFEMYEVNSPQELHIKERWENNRALKSLAVPLGVRSKGDTVMLNLHEKAHGPHGLIAGTTGSGKSELIQSYIMSLAVNFHPYEVGFLLIDYKGGGMAGLFDRLPHLLGTITNLDGTGTMRAMASIKSELERRQRIFNDYNVNSINDYSILFHTGKADEPLPHLFLISDEFAELKKEQPEFMKELVSAARIGRSLGIHLILATQKPSGVVDEQIWSNSKFKIALKVQEVSDSREIIKTEDAASITQPGRAYLKVGNNEVYELFQSAWSGASYKENNANEAVKETDNRVYMVNHMGQLELLNTDLRTHEEKEGLKKTQLDVCMDYIKKIFEQSGVEMVRKPWLPPLKEKIVSPYINIEEIKDAAYFKELDLNIPVGIIDIPEMQIQSEFIVDFSKKGNMAVFGSGSSGKTFTLTNAVLSLAVKNSPDNLQFFIVDFGNSGLMPLREIPHVRDYIKFDEKEKYLKFTRIIEKEAGRRKDLFGKNNVPNFNVYNETFAEKIPACIIVIDNYNGINEMGDFAQDFIKKITLDGAGLGIYVIAAASGSGAFKYGLINNFKIKISHFLEDASEMNTLIGRTKYKLQEVPGQAMIKMENVNIMQCYTPVNFKTEKEYSINLKNLVAKIKDNYTGIKPEGIKMLPEKLTLEMLMSYEENELIRKGFSDKIKKSDEICENKRTAVAAGLEKEEVSPVYINLDGGAKLILGGPQSGKTNFLKSAIMQLEGQEVYIADSKASELYSLRSRASVYCEFSKESPVKLAEFLEKVSAERINDFKRAKEENSELIPKIFYESMKKTTVIIDSVDEFLVMAASDLTAMGRLERAFKTAEETGITFIGSSGIKGLKGFDKVTEMFRQASEGIILVNPDNQLIVQVYIKCPKILPLDYGVVFKKGSGILVKVPYAEK